MKKMKREERDEVARRRAKEVAARLHCSHSCLPSFPAAAAMHCDANFVCIVRRYTHVHSSRAPVGRETRRGEEATKEKRKNASIVIYAAIHVTGRASLAFMSREHDRGE